MPKGNEAQKDFVSVFELIPTKTPRDTNKGAGLLERWDGPGGGCESSHKLRKVSSHSLTCFFCNAFNDVI